MSENLATVAEPLDRPTVMDHLGDDVLALNDWRGHRVWAVWCSGRLGVLGDLGSAISLYKSCYAGPLPQASGIAGTLEG